MIKSLRHITAAEVRHQQKESVRKIKREREREGKKPQPTEREAEIEIFSMMGFDSANSSSQALLVNKYKKLSTKLKTKVFNFTVKV